MITSLSIKHFKSVRSLSIPCRQVNLFIGAPDTGKTNILEALHLCGNLGWQAPVGPSLRLRQDIGFEALFYRQFLDQPFEIAFQHDMPWRLVAHMDGSDRNLAIDASPAAKLSVKFGSTANVPPLFFIRYYIYGSSEAWQYATNSVEGTRLIAPPHGSNLLYIARHNAKVYEFLKETVAGLNWKLRFDANLKSFRLSEVREDEIFDYNLDLLSDSLKRLFFYGSIVLSSNKATIVLDEPDVFAFPPYPKMLGEMIAADESNQYFMTTHNPYFLAAIVAKVRADQLALFVCHRDPEGATSATLLSPAQIEQVIEMGASVFFNLDDFLEA